MSEELVLGSGRKCRREEVAFFGLVARIRRVMESSPLTTEASAHIVSRTSCSMALTLVIISYCTAVILLLAWGHVIYFLATSQITFEIWMPRVVGERTIKVVSDLDALFYQRKKFSELGKAMSQMASGPRD